MLLLGFYFLLRPGEYAHTDNEQVTPFRLCDTHLLRGANRLHPVTSSDVKLRSATHVALEFTNQKKKTQLIILSACSTPGRDRRPITLPRPIGIG